MTPEEKKRIVTRMEEEIGDLLSKPKARGGYDCCGCSTYELILAHAIQIVEESA